MRTTLSPLLGFLLALYLTLSSASATMTLPYPVGSPDVQPPNCIDPDWQGTTAVGAGVALFYFVDRGAVDGAGFFLYQESNGVYHDASFGDLQRGGGSRLLRDDADPCTNLSPNGADSLLV